MSDYCEHGFGPDSCNHAGCRYEHVSRQVLLDELKRLREEVAGHANALERRAVEAWNRCVAEHEAELTLQKYETARWKEACGHASIELVKEQREVRRVIIAIIHEMGGLVEGEPPKDINYLQRLRELVGMEKENEKLRADLAAARVGHPSWSSKDLGETQLALLRERDQARADLAAVQAEYKKLLSLHGTAKAEHEERAAEWKEAQEVFMTAEGEVEK